MSSSRSDSFREEEEKKENKCPECGNTNILVDYDTGEAICGKCGLVIKDIVVDSGPEWRAFNERERQKKERVGSPLTQQIHDQGLSTNIDSSNRDATGRDLKGDERWKWYRLRKWNRRSKISDNSSRNLSKAFNNLKNISGSLDLPEFISESASTVYRKALDKDLIRGRSIRDVMLACVYIATRKSHKMDYTMDEVCSKVPGTTKKTLYNTYSYLLRELEISVPRKEHSTIVSRVENKLYEDYKSSFRWCDKVFSIGQVTHNIITDLYYLKDGKRGYNRNLYVVGKAPSSIVAGCFYVSGCLLSGDGKMFTQRQIADASRVTEVTLRSIYKSLLLGIWGLDDVSEINNIREILEYFEDNYKVGEDISYNTLTEKFPKKLDFYLQILEQRTGLIGSYEENGERYFEYAFPL